MALIRILLGDRWSIRLLLLSLLVHAVLASSFHLSPDETQYALYSVNLGWSYFDHPPLVGWVQWPWAQLGGHDILMRIVPMLSWALAAVGLMALTAELAASQQVLAARAALLLWSLSPIPHLLGLALVPDTLLLPITCAVMVVTWRLCDARHARNWRAWLALGVLLGLAGLTKYTAVLIAVGVVLALLLAHGPRLLSWPQPWVAALLAAAVISPVILWNAANDWISFAYQFSHAKGNAEWRPTRVAAFLIVQVLGYGLLLVVGSWSAWRLLRRARDNAGGESQLISIALFCACFGLPTLLLLSYLSGRGSTLPHWSAAAWAALVPAAALGCISLWQKRRRTLMALGIFQAVSCIGMAVLMLSGGIASEPGAQATSSPGQKVPGAQFNPIADLYGWDKAAQIAAQRARALAEKNTDGIKPPTLAVFNWTLASRIAWYAGPQPVKVVQRHLDQFGLWWGVLERGENVLLVDWSQMSFAPPVGVDQFERCELLDQQPVQRWGRQIAHFNFMLCRNWQGPVGLPLETAR